MVVEEEVEEEGEEPVEDAVEYNHRVQVELASMIGGLFSNKLFLALQECHEYCVTKN